MPPQFHLSRSGFGLKEVGRVGRMFRAGVLCLTMLTGCATEPRTPYTELEASAAMPIGEQNVRYWADAAGHPGQGAPRPAIVQKGKPFVYLALSGGGGGGAYGAGVLKGWTSLGSRPEFTLVSGVSTGALIAPFAFLGSDYDDLLKDIYTNGGAERLIQQANPIGALLGPGAVGPGRLRRLVARYLSDEMIGAIANEDSKGRRLLVVTTNLDAQRAVVWDMGAIAASGRPGAYELFRDVLAASASVPVVFAPQLINVEAGDRVFQEMHADGAISAPIYTLPGAVLLGGTSVTRGSRPSLYLIVNDRIDSGFAVVPNRVADIAAQSFSTLNRVDTKAVLALSYQAARREGLGFHLSYIDPDHPDRGGTGFETDAMRDLYEYGFEKARTGDLWTTDLTKIEPPAPKAKIAEQ